MAEKKTLRVYFAPNTFPVDVFSGALLPDYEILQDDREPDIIVLNTKSNIPHHHWLTALKMIRARKRFGMRPLLCSNQGEAFPRPRLRGLDYMFSFQPARGKNCLRVPVDHWTSCEKRRSEVQSAARKNPSTASGTRFCNFIYSAKRYPSVQVRGYFCRLLTRYKRVDCPGASHNNAPRLIHYGSRGGREAKLDFMASSKFTIAFENISTDYYLTEKIFHPLSVGSVPIYWGCRRVKEYVNPDCFINCHDYKSFAEVVERVKEVDQDPALYAKYREAPPVLPDSRLHEVRRGMEQRAREMAEEALERRDWKNEYPNSRQIVMMALRNADAIKGRFGIFRKDSDWTALMNLLPLYREILLSGGWNT